MALRTRIAAGAATLALSLAGLAVATVPASAAPQSTGTHAVTPDIIRMQYYYGRGATAALAEQEAFMLAGFGGFSVNQCHLVSLTGQTGGYYATILCQSFN